jgi:hypothetical protein
MKTRAWKGAALACLAAVALAGCGKPFPSASYLDKQRFLAVIAEPLEAAPGEQITFTAVVANKDGTLYAGPVAWAVVTGASLREGGQAQLDPHDEYLQAPGQPPFAWTVPAWDDLPAKFGSPEKNGYLETIGAVAFENGDPNGKQLTAFKLFIISNRPAAERDINPTIASLDVYSNGALIAPAADGDYNVALGTAVLDAHPARDLGALTYEWFSNDKSFAPNFGATQKLVSPVTSELTVFLVIRQSYFFYHDDSTKTRLTGEDWRRVEVQFGTD